MLAVLPATTPATSSSAVDRRSMSRPADQHTEPGDDQRGDEADDQGERPTRGDHLPTATFRSARAECRMRTPESLMRAIPASSSVCRAPPRRPRRRPPPARRSGGRAARSRSRSRRDRITTIPSTNPMVQPVTPISSYLTPRAPPRSHGAKSARSVSTPATCRWDSADLRWSETGAQRLRPPPRRLREGLGGGLAGQRGFRPAR